MAITGKKFGQLVCDRARKDPEFKRQVIRELKRLLVESKKNKDSKCTVHLVRAILALQHLK
jgi:hypothetical protein